MDDGAHGWIKSSYLDGPRIHMRGCALTIVHIKVIDNSWPFKLEYDIEWQ